MGRFAQIAGRTLCLVILAASLSFSVGGHAQNKPAPTDSTGAAPTAAPQQTTNPIRVLSNEVIVPVTVTDKTGESVLNLTQQDFHVYDDGAEQTIDHWDLDGDPIAVALVLETSSRPHAMIPEVHSLGSIFTETAMALDGEAAVITYDSSVEVRQPFTQDHDAVEKAITGAAFEEPGRRLFDAMDRAVQLLKTEPPKWRRVMLVVGESRDDGSTANFGAIVRDASFANIAIYSVGPSSTVRDIVQDGPALWAAPAIFLLQQGIYKRKDHDLEVAPAATGGAHYSTVRAATLRDALDKIGGELHEQFIVGYRPNSERSPGYHAITVTVAKPNLSVRARPGYYVTATAN